MKRVKMPTQLVDVVTDADVDDEDHVGNGLLQIWKILKLGLVKNLSLGLVDKLMFS